jgi:chromosome segregation ATPase
MIRVLVDNRPLPGTRRRPFDPLGEHRQDTVTLAVVFVGTDEGPPRPEYYILDGDTVPIEPAPGGRPHRPLPSRTEYRARLKKVGIGPQYLRLMELAQGQIAGFCLRKPEPLFDELHGIIGGRDELERWRKHVDELRRLQEQHTTVGQDLRRAREALDSLGLRVRGYQSWREKERRIRAIEAALPHSEVAEAREAGARARRDLATKEAERDRLEREHAAENERHDGAQTRIKELESRLRDLNIRTKDLQERRDQAVGELAQTRAKLGEIERLREAARGVQVGDVDALRAEAEGIHAQIAGGQSTEAQREQERHRLTRELDQVQKGIRPYPDGVNAFREILRKAGIPHHVLAEVIELKDPAWAEAVEGLLARHRFAILVQDPATWPTAAALARREKYPHGVLAPDVRGQSPADQASVFSIVEVREARYRSLLARLLRPVLAGAHEEPLVPASRGLKVDREGFVVSRVEAYHAAATDLYLGQEAVRRHGERLRGELDDLARLSATWKTDERELRATLAGVKDEVRRQEARLAWEAVRVDFEERKIRTTELTDRIQAIEVERDSVGAEQDAFREELGRQREVARKSSAQSEELRDRLDETATAIGAARAEQERADEVLGRLLAITLPALDTDASAELDRGLSSRALGEMLAGMRRDVERIPPEERDPLLPVNYERQQAEVDATGKRLEEMGAQLEQTRATAEQAHEQFRHTTTLVFRRYFARLKSAGDELDFDIQGQLLPREDGQFRCDIRVGVGDKPRVQYNSEDLSGGQKAALSILMGMTAVSLETDGAGFFVIDEPFAASDVGKINELGRFLQRTGAQYLVSMPTSADIDQCEDWLQAVWTCTKTRGGFDGDGRPVLAPPVKLGFAAGARD